MRDKKYHTGELGEFEPSRIIINLFFNKIITPKRWSELASIYKVSELLLLEAKFLCNEREVCTKMKDQTGRGLPSAEMNSRGITGNQTLPRENLWLMNVLLGLSPLLPSALEALGGSRRRDKAHTRLRSGWVGQQTPLEASSRCP